MDDQFRDIGRQAARGMRNDMVEDRIVSPLANKVGGCATVFFIVLFIALGVGVAIVIARGGGNADSVGPIAIGIGLVGGIVVGSFVGVGVARVLRRLLNG